MNAANSTKTRKRPIQSAPQAHLVGGFVTCAKSLRLVIWELDGVAVGFSTADKIVYGEHAHMHLHVVDPQRRKSGIGSECVRQTVELYFNALELKAPLL